MKKARNLPKFSKDLDNFITFFLENVTMLLENFQKVPNSPDFQRKIKSK
jgi:hypothetical protein